MEVKGIGQATLAKSAAEDSYIGNSRFEEVFDRSRKQFAAVVPRSAVAAPATEVAELDSLRSPYLDAHPLFSSLKRWIAEFHRELQERDQTDPADYLKSTLYTSLIRLLREIILTADRAAQASHLQRVYDWFVRRNRALQPRTTPSFMSPDKAPERLASMGTQVQGIQLYRQSMRTYHPELRPPKDRLQEFRLKVISSPAQETAVPEKPTKAETEEDACLTETASTGFMSATSSPRRMRISSPVLPMPENARLGDPAAVPIGLQSNFLAYRPHDNTEENEMEQMWLGRKNCILATKRTQEETVRMIDVWGKAKGRVNSDLLRKFEVTRFASNFASRAAPTARRNNVPIAQPRTSVPKRDYKQVYEEAEEKEEDEESSEGSENKGVMITERKRAQVVDLRSVEASPSPARRRSSSSNKKSKPLVPDAKTAFNDIDKRRVDQIRRLYGRMITATDDRMELAASSLITSSLSPYNRRIRRPASLVQCLKSLNSVPATHLGTRQQYRMQQFAEIDSIKRHLAREEVQCRTGSVERAVLIPEDFPQGAMTAENFPRPGGRLLVNPFAEPKKRVAKRRRSSKRQ